MKQHHKETCRWKAHKFKQYVFEDAFINQIEYVPGCIDEDSAMGDPPKFCPFCGGKVVVARKTRKRK